jgi:hypothetical protein
MLTHPAVVFVTDRPSNLEHVTIVDSKSIRFMEPGQSIAATLNVERYEQAGRSAAKDPGTTAIVVVHDVRQALAWLCGRTGNPVTCGVAHRAANMTIDTPLPLT